MTATSATMRLGIAGLGVAGALVLPEIAAHPRVHVTAGADLRPAARDAFAAQFQAEAYASVEAMCASPNVDVVSIVTPNRSHAEHAIIAAEHGIAQRTIRAGAAGWRADERVPRSSSQSAPETAGALAGRPQ